MAKGEINVNACYDAIVETIKGDELFKDKHGRWMTNEELYAECRKTVKGLRQIEFDAALEMENEEYSPAVEKYLRRIKFL